RRAGRLTEAGCRRLGMRPRGDPGTGRRRTGWRGRWRSCGRICWGCRGSGWGTIFLPWGVTRCWRRVWRRVWRVWWVSRSVSRTGALALSYAQSRLWFLERLDAGDGAGVRSRYHMAQGVWLRGALDVGALECALGALVDRHEVLRTRLVEGLSGPEQRIDGPGTGFALARLAAGSRDEALAAARAFAGSGFDLSREWPLRGCVIGLGSEDHVLVLVLHHVAGDGWSVGILARELAALYGAAVTGVAARLPGLAVQYADYAAWQRDWLGSGSRIGSWL